MFRRFGSTFPFKAELPIYDLNCYEKTESLRMKKEYIDFNKGKIFIPKRN